MSDESETGIESAEEIPLQEPPDEDVFKILVATDIHLGYAEKDLIRGQDTFNTFEEVLSIAVEKDVDFILLGGDLFHFAKPTPYCMLKCTDLLKKYCFGSKPINIEYLSDPSLNFASLSNPMINYDDPNLNVSIPVFSIHGNHDDLCGPNQVSALDILASSGLVNYFGKWTNLKEIVVSPILLKKGETNLAMYGLSHIRDERLGRLFRDKKVAFEEPANDVLGPNEEWFNLLVLHQNRATNRGTKNYVPEEIIPSFFDFVLWGHEHDCRIEPEVTPNGVLISQPGSTVATSLSAGESGPKYVGLLKIYKNKCRIQPIALKTVRPFVMDELPLSKIDAKLTLEELRETIVRKIEAIIEKIKGEEKYNNGMIPLVRLNVFYSNEQHFINPIKFGQQFVDRVANHENVLQMTVCKNKEARHKMLGEDVAFQIENIQNAEEMVKDYFKTNKDATKMKLLSVDAMTEAVTRYITKGDEEAIEDVFKYQMLKYTEKLKELDMDEDDIDDYLEDLKIQENEAAEDVVKNVLDNPTRVVKRMDRSESDNAEDVVEITDDDDDVVMVPSTSSRPARGRGSRGGRVAKKNDSVASTASPKGRGRDRGRGASGKK